jgi:hypothetical protein
MPTARDDGGDAMTMTPIHTGTVNGKPVRFFRSPLGDGRPDFPWLALDDLMAALALPRPIRRAFSQGLRSDWKDRIRIIMTAQGPTTVVPNAVAQGLFNAVVGQGLCPAALEAEYDDAVLTACPALTIGLDAEEEHAFIAAATFRWAEVQAISPSPFRH